MLRPISKSWEVLKSWRPSSPFKMRYLNFLVLHCKLPLYRQEALLVSRYLLTSEVLIDAYIIGISILGSILIYPAGGMSYIDAVFMSASASTQCGLNV